MDRVRPSPRAGSPPSLYEYEPIVPTNPVANAAGFFSRLKHPFSLISIGACLTTGTFRSPVYRFAAAFLGRPRGRKVDSRRSRWC